MNQSLSDLFSALAQSEQAAEDEKNKYIKAKTDIQASNEKLKKERMRKCEIVEEIQALPKLQETLKTNSMHFMAQVKQFSEQYGLLKNNKKKRLEKARSDLKQLVAEMDELQRDIQDSIQDEEIQIKRLQSENFALQIESESEEFLQVNKDLEKYKTDEIEAQAEQLHAQLSDITDLLRRQEGQSLQKQYQRSQKKRQKLMSKLKPRQADYKDEGKDKNAGDSLRRYEIQRKLNEMRPHNHNVLQEDRPDLSGFAGTTQKISFTSSPSFHIDTGGEEAASVLLQVEESSGAFQNCSSQKDRQKPMVTSNFEISTEESEYAQPGKKEILSPCDGLEQASKTGKRDLLLACQVNLDCVKEKETTSRPQSAPAEASDVKAQEGQKSFISQDILCPSASSVEEPPAHSGHDTLDNSSQNTIFISSPN
ncbi:hypothetical protein PoB_001224800 [Plakobranchus ocellatus]|uniref:Uncharacterized protein n=1 Tax=Plakobranchus ocellatus TaxID=259542 RepID=A0AAV3YT64_9GAST|nr:hypothetical protein PoB_001224800 [Plakobranchus ocellatus]